MDILFSHFVRIRAMAATEDKLPQTGNALIVLFNIYPLLGEIIKTRKNEYEIVKLLGKGGFGKLPI
jgi:uncharacterized pyridoxamine 5'-phosphate oxidase family protein